MMLNSECSMKRYEETSESYWCERPGIILSSALLSVTIPQASWHRFHMSFLQVLFCEHIRHKVMVTLHKVIVTPHYVYCCDRVIGCV